MFSHRILEYEGQEYNIPDEGLDDAAYREENPYGPRNWRLGGYDFRYHLEGAIERHRTSIIEGEYLDRKSGWPHRAHIIASESILLYFEAKEQK